MFDDVREILAHKVNSSIVKFLHKLRLRVSPGERSLEISMRGLLITSEDTILDLIQAKVQTSYTIEKRLPTTKKLVI
jgi:hypothetical protein